MKAIILAAGEGIKVRNRNESIPVCLMKLGKETILEKQIAILNKFNVNDVVVIVGKEGNCWSKKNLDTIAKISKKIIINPKNRTTPSSSSLALGLNFFTPSSCLIIDGDLVFEEGIIKEVLKNENNNLILIEERVNESGAYVKLKGDTVNEIGRNINTNKRYGGLIKIDKNLYEILKIQLKKKEHEKLDYVEIINKNLKNIDLKVVDIDKIGGEDGTLFGVEPLKGGSLAETRIIKKLEKKTTYIVRKEALEGKEKLRDEIIWLNNLPLDLIPYFPKLINYEIRGESSWYEMEYSPSQTFRYLIINKIIKKEEALYILKNLIEIMFKKFYSKRISKNKGVYAKKVHLDRIKSRALMTCEKAPIFRRIISCKYVIINGKKYLNLPQILKLIEQDKELLKKIEPPFLCMVHGDLHFDDFLVDISQMPMLKFILIDPRGLDNTYNYDYDLGKLWFSIHGKYDLVHEGLFNLDYKFVNEDFVVKTSFVDSEIFLIYDYLYEEAKKFLRKFNLIKKDNNWELRTLFSEMAHFCSNMPFHLKYDNKERMAISLYIRGIKLANEIFSNYSKAKIQTRKSFFNINSLKDYFEAKKRFR